MKAGIYLGQEKIEIRELEMPEVGDRDVLIQNIYSSICGTDVAVYKHGPNTGHKVTVGGEFGHETVSRVVKVGKDVTNFKVGERVYPYPLYAKNDTKRAGTIGGFSEYILVPEAKRNHSLYPVDERISDKLASLIEPFTVGCRAARRGMIPAGMDRETQKSVYVKGQNAVVFGAGTIGIAAAAAFQYFGMDKVMVCDLSDYRLSLAHKLGFEICNPAKENFKEISQKVFGTAHSLKGETANIDCWLDAAGAESILEQFMELGKIESRFVSVAVNNAMRNLDLLHMTYSQKSIIGSGGYMPEDVWDVQEIMAADTQRLESMITHEFGIDDLEKAIQTAADVEKSGNVVIRF
ncbi:MAG: zinc-binding dehydrogenase [Lachnospiraceae bacterium]